jgi:hypothetical protein
MSASPLIFSTDVKDDGYLMGDVGEGKAQVYSDEVSSTALARWENRWAFLSLDSGPLRQA